MIFICFERENKEERGTTKKKAFVNSQVLSLTTQTNIGALSPPLNLAFKHIQSVSSFNIFYINTCTYTFNMSNLLHGACFV